MTVLKEILSIKGDMMKKVSVLLTCLALLWCGSTVMAQEDEVTDALEVSLSMGIASPGGGITEWNDNINADNGVNFDLGIGYFLKPNMLVGFDFSYDQFDLDFTEEIRNQHHKIYSPRLYLKYAYITENSFEPYAKMHVGLDFMKFTTFVQNPSGTRYRELGYDPAFSYGGTLGLFYFTSDASGLFLEGTYHGTISENAEVVYEDDTYLFNENSNSFSLSLGIRVLFGSGE